MRLGEKCPKCEHQETINWMPSTWDVEKDIAPADSLTNIPTFKIQGLAVWEDNQWTYRFSKDGQYVIRILTTIYHARGKWSIDKAKHYDSNTKVLRDEKQK